MFETSIKGLSLKRFIGDCGDLLEWMALRTHQAQEERAQQNLHAQDYQTLLPLARVDGHNSKGIRTIRIRPLFSGYLFVGVENDQRWQPIVSTFGVRSIVGWLDRMTVPPKIKSSDIDELKSRIAAAGGAFHMGLSRPQDIKPGLLVRILFGPFRDRTALVQADCVSRVEVLLHAAGALSKLRLPKECLTAA